MEILFFQIVLFAIIAIAGSESKFRLFIVVTCSIIFTFIMVNTSALSIIQFLTIGIATNFCLKKIQQKEDHEESKIHYRTNYGGYIPIPDTKVILVKGILISLFFSIIYIVFIYWFTSSIFLKLDLVDLDFKIKNIFGYIFSIILYLGWVFVPALLLNYAIVSIFDKIKRLKKL